MGAKHMIKPASEWLNEVGEAVGNDMFCGEPHQPGHRTEAIIKRIQASALATAADICTRLHYSSDNTDCAKAILKEADKLEL